MRVFSASLEEFRGKLVANELFRNMEAQFPRIVGHTVAQSEAAAWRASLPRLDLALRGAALRGDVHITLEERIPYFSKRIDACLFAIADVLPAHDVPGLFGHTEEGTPHTVIIELKGWGDAKALDSGNVETFIGGAYREEPHPSAQANGYQKHIEDFRRAFQGESRLSSQPPDCANAMSAS